MTLTRQAWSQLSPGGQAAAMAIPASRPVWPFVLLGLAPVVAGLWLFDAAAWPVYVVFAFLVLVTDFFWLDVASALPVSLPYLAVTGAFAYIGGIPTVPIFFLTSWLVVIPLKLLLYKRGLFRPPRYFKQILDAIAQEPRRFPQVFIGSTLNLASLTTGNTARWLGFQVLLGHLPFFAAAACAEAAALLWMGTLYFVSPAPATQAMRGEAAEVNRDMAMLSGCAPVPLLFLILYGYHTHGLPAAGAWSLSTLVFHFMARTLNERRLMLEEQRRVLEERNRRLEELHGEIELYTRTVSHDLRTPLSAAIGALDVLSEELEAGLSNEGEEFHAMLVNNLERAYRMLEGLQGVTRTVQRREETIAFPMSELVQEVAEELAADVATRGIAIEVADGFPTVTGQREKLREVWRNLARNAVKYVARSPAPCVRLGWRQGSDGPVFFVADNGIGIPPQYHEAIFHPFRRIPEKDTIPTEGMGLGLSLVRQLVERQGGRVRVESAVGKGATSGFTAGKSVRRKASMGPGGPAWPAGR